MATYLTKEEELELGGFIQKAQRVQALREASPASETYTLDGESITAAQVPLIEKAGKGAVEKLLDHNLALVWSRARKFKARNPSAPDLDDLAQEGIIGLLTAAAKYDPKLGNKFSTVAFYWIDQAIARSVNKTGRMIRLPENRVQDFFNITKIRALHERDNLTPHELDEIAMAELKLSKTEFNNIMIAAQNPTSLSRPVGTSEGTKELIDYIADSETQESSETVALREGMTSILFEKLENLSELEREIITASFLIEDTKSKRSTLNEIREAHNLTPQKLKRIARDALAKLNSELTSLDISFADFID